MDTFSNHFLYNRNEIYTDFNDSDDKLGYVIPSPSPRGKWWAFVFRDGVFEGKLLALFMCLMYRVGEGGRNPVLTAKHQKLFQVFPPPPKYFTVIIGNVQQLQFLLNKNRIFLPLGLDAFTSGSNILSSLFLLKCLHFPPINVLSWVSPGKLEKARWAFPLLNSS